MFTCMEGQDLLELLQFGDSFEVKVVVENLKVLANATPEAKLSLVKLLREHGKTVALDV